MKKVGQQSQVVMGRLIPEVPPAHRSYTYMPRISQVCLIGMSVSRHVLEVYP